MASPPFDASKAVTFDLSRGEIRKDDGERRVLISARAITALCQAAGDDATSAFGQSLGESIGAAIAARFERSGGNARGAVIESIVEHVAGELAVAGLGTISAERWGRALVLVVDHASAESDKVLVPLLGAIVSRAAKVQARCVRLSREGDRARFLVAGEVGAGKVRDWMNAGVPWGEALVRLHPPSQHGGQS
jgi:pimeloyl-ACP methyl ester carboxylesterase